MTRTHVTWDFSKGPDGVAVETPFTPEEEAAADAAEEAANAPANYPLQRYQFLAMLTVGNLAPLVEPAVASIKDPVQKAVAQAKFDATQVFDRKDPLLVALAAAAGLTPAQVDAYWMQAKDL